MWSNRISTASVGKISAFQRRLEMRYFLIAELIKNLLTHTHSVTRTHKHIHTHTHTYQYLQSYTPSYTASDQSACDFVYWDQKSKQNLSFNRFAYWKLILYSYLKRCVTACIIHCSFICFEQRCQRNSTC